MGTLPEPPPWSLGLCHSKGAAGESAGGVQYLKNN